MPCPGMTVNLQNGSPAVLRRRQSQQIIQKGVSHLR